MLDKPMRALSQAEIDGFGEMVNFPKTLGVQIISATEVEVVGELAVTSAITNHTPNVHGGAVMSLGDALGAIGAFLNVPEGAQGTTTIESKTNFIRPAMQGDILTGVSTPLSRGKRLSVWQTEITRADGKRVAMVTQTQIYL
ncbi:PaaI family thioesterase [Alphaproteobacteria bacterium]|nr:PaaI family thioesterase [Alphaproteobacteria bacterium]MDC0147806.1 PaaI family thioesterase [Alphaproteobacteria bacterium]